MGAWGDGVFENDDAADWAYELQDADDVGGLLLETFEAALADDADASGASRAVAAAAWLTATPLERSGFDIDVEAERPALTPQLREAGVRALDAALAEGSEWRELWEEAGETLPIADAERIRERLT